MKQTIALILLLVSSNIYSQSPYQNLKKYWYYRERLKNFVYVSPNFDEAGTNIPAEIISPDKNTISWDDGNGALNQYISVLATEYRLLKNSHQDYSETIKSLYYALKSFERLDKTAESYYRANKEQFDSDLNGFFIRNDATPDFWTKYNKYGINPYFQHTSFDKGDNTQNSLDNCIHYLESFSLVNALVDDETINGININFKQLAQDNTKRILQNMYHPGDPQPIVPVPWIFDFYQYTWYLANPVNGGLIPNENGGGRDGTMLYASYGFSKAGNRILGYDAFNEMLFSYEISKALLSHPVGAKELQLGAYLRTTLLPLPLITYMDIVLSFGDETVFELIKYPKYIDIGIAKIPCYVTDASLTNSWKILDDYKSRSLCATGDIDIVSGKSPYEVLIQKQNESPVYKYEHFPLIWSVSTNNFAYIKQEDRQYIRNLLDEAPECGPYKIANNNRLEYDDYEWSSPSRLIWPERLGENSFLGYYNGLDYMLLHNLYWLCNFRYPENQEFHQYIGIPYMSIARNQITCSSPINSLLFHVYLIAGNTVSLKPGFSAQAKVGKGFTARIATNMTEGEVPLNFQKVSLTDYQQCSNNLVVNKLQVLAKSMSSQNNSLEHSNQDISVYPNPFSKNINIQNSSSLEISRIEIYNTTGMLIKKVLPVTDNLNFDLNDLQNGIYFLRVVYCNDSFTNVKIVKQ
ncbi:MAG TPA: T9SS type A sorting domain-containing protein [Williamwhitmania sp.]|nr:T9SS type A sorting domain-containing protein [Williamwhitmania sp.]